MKNEVTESALLRRINRKLRKDYQFFHRCSERSRGFYDLGRYYVVDLYNSGVVDLQVDIEHLGRKLDVLLPSESLRAE